MTTTTTRTIQLPVGIWAFDPHHTSIAFVARHMMVSKVRGTFGTFTGQVEVADELTDSKVAVEIDAASVTTGSPDRDGHLLSPDFFDIANHSKIRFESTGIVEHGVRWEMNGDLTIKDVTRPVALEFTFEGTNVNPFGKTVAMFSATTEIDRSDWDLNWNLALESGGVLVSKKIKIEIEAELIRA